MYKTIQTGVERYLRIVNFLSKAGENIEKFENGSNKLHSLWGYLRKTLQFFVFFFFVFFFFHFKQI